MNELTPNYNQPLSWWKRILSFIFYSILWIPTIFICLCLFLLLCIFILFTIPDEPKPNDKMVKLKLVKDSNFLPTALKQYADRYGRMPTQEQGLSALIKKPTLPPISNNYQPIITNKALVKDPWWTPYQLKIDSNGDYEIITLGRDKTVGGEGKNADFNILNEEEYPKEFRK